MDEEELETVASARIPLDAQYKNWLVAGTFCDSVGDQTNFEVMCDELTSRGCGRSFKTHEDSQQCAYIIVDPGDQDALAAVQEMRETIENEGYLDHDRYWEKMCELVENVWQTESLAWKLQVVEQAELDSSLALKRRIPDGEIQRIIEEYVMECS